jgi:ribose transport system substrate-binding protein
MSKRWKMALTALALSVSLAACGTGTPSAEDGTKGSSVGTASKSGSEAISSSSGAVLSSSDASSSSSENASGDSRSYEITLPDEDALKWSYTSVDDLRVEPGSSVAIVAKELNLEYWKAVREGARQAINEINEANGFEKDDAVTLTFDGPKSSSDVDGQINAIDSVLSENPTALCIAAIDMESCKTQLEAAKENGIPVVTLDSGIESPLVTANCTTDNIAAGREAMRKLCESISDLGKIAILTHAQSQKSAADRYKGFAEEIAEHPKVSVVANLEENSEESIETMVESTLDVTPELDGIICTNESTTEKVLEVLSIMNRTDIRVVGFDLGEAQADAIRAGSEYGAVAENPRGMGYAAVVAALRASAGQEIDAQIDTGYRWIDADTIDLPRNEAYLY